MADSVAVNGVQPSEISNEMVAYLLTVSILVGPEYSKSIVPSQGLPIIAGTDKATILSTYIECLQAVKRPFSSKHGE